ncbi:hypothetical protein VTN96DRAFT_7271 [Rasamsonia emersonii]|uniref:Nucleic acid-binding protein n=1 Tax=Rasamsonia emersonii (strain ATCC 16479 / CBS 393.64 / IMI 116815) TaxID=1408163 RepID=A0A0F4YUG8_RASE3|nr:hypothetical protein T310_4256 [Rasamsonia emersonii CBS 393.64]KKA21735.1 hypothetical protein T310_4256 [Rasamsonia emersonii CBS 393.64]
MSKKLIFLMGAPSGMLEWDNIELLNTAVPPFNGADVSGNRHGASPDTQPVRWRLLTNRETLQWTYGSDNYVDTKKTLFLTTQDLLSTYPDVAGEEVLSQFYDHSLSIHETSLISVSDSGNIGSIEESSSLTESIEFSVQTEREGQQARETTLLSIPGPLSNLEDIPNAAYLRSIVPQTMTVNLVVGILGVNPPRRVRTRQAKWDMQIVELIVGDETRTGFGVTFWLPATEDGLEEDELGQKLAGLRPRDIILLRSVGLSSFRERVYGQSLRKGLTKVDLLHRQPIDATDPGGLYSSKAINAASNDNALLMKAQRVREWMISYVGLRPHGVGGEAAQPQLRHLPPDTQ